MPQRVAPPLFVHAESIRRPWAIRLAVALVLLGAALNLHSLWASNSLGLVDDETHYYLWSQHLDFGYYSKPPGIALIMHAAEMVGQWFGIPHATAAVLRSAAVVFSIMTGLLSIALARRIFRDDAAALLVTLFSAAVPMFMVGALLITIDSPMYLCWAATVYCLWRALETPWQKSGAYDSTGKPQPAAIWLYAAGLALGLGMLVKPILIVIPASMLLASFLNRQIKNAILRWHSLGALAVAAVLWIPVLIWNIQHHWVMFLHIGGQIGIHPQAAPAPSFAWLTRPLIYLGTQAGGLGGIMFVVLLIAIIKALRQIRSAHTTTPIDDQSRAATAFTFLLCLTIPLLAGCFLLSLFTNVEPNWPVAGYFTGMILLAGVTAGFWADRAHKDHRAWKWWTIGTVLWGLLAGGLIQNMQIFYPMAQQHLAKFQGTPAYEKSFWHPRHWDLSIRLREPEPRAADIETQVKAMAASGHTPTVVATRYNIASSLNFYLPGRPFVFCIGPWVGARQSQYDIWPGLNEKDPAGRLVHAGEDVLLVGDLSPADEVMIRKAFDHVDDAQLLPVMYLGINLRSIRVQRCFGFQGLPDTPGGGSY